MPDVDSRLKHDLLVVKKAMQLVSDGWAVKARVDEWFEDPDVISGYRPDILAEKAGEFLIVEVRKEARDHPKIVALRLFVRNHSNYKLEIIDVDDSPGELRNAG